MKTATLVLKNFSRNKTRLILSSVGLILAIALILSTFMISHSMQIQIGLEVERYGPNIVVMPLSESISVPYGSVVVGNTTILEEDYEKIYSIPNSGNLRVVSPKIYGQVRFENNTLLVVGIIAEQEAEMKRWWNVEGSLPVDGANHALVGSELKTILNASVGFNLKLNNVNFTVVGILEETGSVDDYSLFLPLHNAQILLGLEGLLSSIDVGALCQDCPVEVMAQQITDAIPNVKASPIKQAVETRTKAVEQTVSFSILLGSIILVVSCAGISNTMLSSVYERTREIGILMSLGADDRHLYKMFILESLILGLIGGLLGCLFGWISSTLIGPNVLNTTVSFSSVPVYIFPTCIALSIIICVGASLYPAWRASKIDPVQALRTL